MIKAAEQRDGDAPFLLGCLYLEGKGVAQSNVKAFAWINASINSRLTAKRSQGGLASLLQSTRHSVRSLAYSQKVVDRLSTKMTPGQINQTERLARKLFLKYRHTDV